METYRIEGLNFTYPGQMSEQQKRSSFATDSNRSAHALDDINLNIEPGAFVVLCGPSGCGKTTLLRQLKPSIAPHGIKSGAIYFEDTPLEEVSPRDAAAKIGFVLQSPDNQIVTDKVWHELAFGLESLGHKTPEIRLRVAEMASFFGIQTWFHKPVAELSGGQKQLLALASVMAMQPTVLILDEPTSQLDPIAAGDFLGTVAKINRELGVTVILTEHRLEEAFPLASRAVVMDKGRILADGPPRKVGLSLRECESGMFLAMPTPMRVWGGMQRTEGRRQRLEKTVEVDCCETFDGIVNDDVYEDVPITARDGAKWLNRIVETQPIAQDITFEDRITLTGLKPAIRLDGVWFKYEKNLPDVIKGLTFKARYGEITAILGGNGTGKTTTLGLIAGLYKPYRGSIDVDTTVYALPQNPQALFVTKTVREDLLEMLSGLRLSKEEKEHKLAFIEKLCRLEGLLERHPYDLSGGEQQRAALAKVLLLEPKIVLLDEPTKGLDAEYKQIFAGILQKLAESGTAVVLVSHDVEFCAEYAHRCALFFDGAIVTENTPREFFSGNNFYTTTANRMARQVLPKAITAEDVVYALGGKPPSKPKMPDMFVFPGLIRGPLSFGERDGAPDRPPAKNTLASHSDILNQARYDREGELRTQPRNNESFLSQLKPRGLLFFVFALLLLAGVSFAAVHWENFTAFISSGREAIAVAQEGALIYAGILLTIVFGITGMVFTLSWKRGALAPVRQKRSLSKRTIIASVLVLLTIPITIVLGFHLFGDRRFLFISMLIILQTMLPFALVFESRKPQAREVIVIAVLCSIAVAGRGAFFMLPQFKPVIALVIISGVAFGGESGFLVGAMTAFVSNMFFGQGPWTPWQMFAFGIIGLFAGILFRKGLLSRAPLPLGIFGGLATLLIYGGIMNPANIIIWQPNPTVEMFLLAFLHGIPFDLVHAAATVFFLIIISQPMLEKLDRIKVKYGLVE